MDEATKVIKSIVLDKRLVSYGFFLLALHIAGVLIFYRHIPEFDILSHFWFGYVLSEYSSKAGDSLNLQMRLAQNFRKRGWTKANLKQVDFLVRLAGFLIIGGLFWEWFELFFSPLFGIAPDPFFVFPITLQNIDGAIDVSVGVLAATLAFLISTKWKK